MARATRRLARAAKRRLPGWAITRYSFLGTVINDGVDQSPQQDMRWQAVKVVDGVVHGLWGLRTKRDAVQAALECEHALQRVGREST